MKKSREYLLREVIIGTILWIIMLCVLLKAGAYTKSRLWNTSEMTVVEGKLKAKYNSNKEPILLLDNGISYEFEEIVLNSDSIDIREMLTHADTGDYLQLIVYDGLEHNYIYAFNCNGKEYLTLTETFKIFDWNYRTFVFTGQIKEIKIRKGDHVKKGQLIMVADGKVGAVTTHNLKIKAKISGAVEEICVKEGDRVKTFEPLVIIRYK